MILTFVKDVDIKGTVGERRMNCVICFSDANYIYDGKSLCYDCMKKEVKSNEEDSILNIWNKVT